MMLIETYIHVIGFFLTISLLGGYIGYRYFKKRKK